MSKFYDCSPFIIYYNNDTNYFDYIDVYSYDENAYFDDHCIAHCIITSYNLIPYLSKDTKLLIFNPTLAYASDLDQIIKFVSIKDIEIESYFKLGQDSLYKASISTNYLPKHEYYHALLSAYNKYLHEQDTFNKQFMLNKNEKSRINTLFKRKFEEIDELLIFPEDLNVTDKISKALFASITYNNFTPKYCFGPQISKVIFANPNTIILWTDGTKTIATCQKDTEFLKEIGLSIAIAKKILGSWSNFQKYIDNAIISGTKEDHVAAKQRRKEKCLQKNNQR